VPDGSISVDLPPGTYKATVESAGYKPQTLDVTIEENGVAVKNFELNK
jgi:HSP20 family molecular chaperone IbpA